MEWKIATEVHEEFINSDPALKRWWARARETNPALAVFSSEFAFTKKATRDKPAANLTTARAIIEEEALPYCDAVAVPYMGLIKKDNPRFTRLENAYQAANEKLDKTIESIYSALQRTKSKTIGCKNCKSSVTRSYIGRDLECPVCHNIIVADSYRKLYDAAEALYKTARSNRLPEEQKFTLQAGVCFVVGGWTLKEE